MLHNTYNSAIGGKFENNQLKVKHIVSYYAFPADLKQIIQHYVSSRNLKRK